MMDHKEMAEMITEMVDNGTFDERAVKLMFDAAAYRGMMLERSKNRPEITLDNAEKPVIVPPIRD
jgi:hypothetical protein